MLLIKKLRGQLLVVNTGALMLTVMRSILLTIFGCLFSVIVQSKPLDEASELIQQWLNLEKQISVLRNEWQQQQPILLQRIDLLNREKQQLEKAVVENKLQTSDVNTKREALLTEQNGLEAQQVKFHVRLQQLIQILDSYSTILPPPLVSVWQKEQSHLTLDASPSEKLQVALAQLTKLMEFDQRITVNETIVTTPDGKEVLVNQLFLGVGAAWFVSQDGGYSGLGYVKDNQWQWQFRNDLDVTVIQNAIAIYQKQIPSDWVTLPFETSQQTNWSKRVLHE